eukprot:CAMPEP_0201875774 /NCGR_PEP_ID=MMETSP0902-20130614/7655_1 /ASSEMBLY_ACC=CAM_ASM_000551 /TAXON_ID=420261 /ORGANISM="Thalassiosira antarctica, Strain CCMP982" /LENGTH=117 /DNA_ID=CAMNT_0048402895 /DNA_START=132 /DNA_END=485 /DNA_ORIENTATION=+
MASVLSSPTPSKSGIPPGIIDSKLGTVTSKAVVIHVLTPSFVVVPSSQQSRTWEHMSDRPGKRNALSTSAFDLATAACIVESHFVNVYTPDQGAKSIPWISGGAAFREFFATNDASN